MIRFKYWKVTPDWEAINEVDYFIYRWNSEIMLNRLIELA